ncbi:hypothetical protein [Burkholderia phage vB_BglM_WTB]
MNLQLDGNNGKIDVTITKFPALVGWEMQNDFREFVRSNDKAFRRAFTFAVLEYARVIRNGQEQLLKTDALVNNNLETWQNVERVFTEILRYNGIEADTFAAQMENWAEQAGSKLAVYFIASMGDLIGPAMDALKQQTE